MQAMTTVVSPTITTGNAVFVMVPVDQWNAMVKQMKHYERIAKLRKLAEQMEEDPTHNALPWDQVKQGLIERGLLEAAHATA